jgi:hypothetical protein
MTVATVLYCAFVSASTDGEYVPEWPIVYPGRAHKPAKYAKMGLMLVYYMLGYAFAHPV